ncbi:tyramine oxidase [Rhodococcus sp. 05-2255-3B1]|uniref:primary-amine oxidase n=1 Tax=unclassified Rhodococcus (in: high G+C Gram-positive bacteria) TaxID=192944 RepID=UPI000B9B949D|nr:MULTISPECIES: primary-amine oxidase [unclassified Rhodococcus (in: high G+C Gram-positive bacteria)]OZE08182.1 tyramine oxidase [Rhodococcus sp. 05-2255-3B1]OZE15221.1 tyramine oxidase [Rhodococcus sp. 05-2255-3C]OZE23014.1 tyramine oxidase [Rhodococcus sp. 05-2255-2A2]
MTFHPLDPLSSDEFATVAEVLGRDHGVGDGWRYASIEMIEPAKSEIAAFDADGTVPARRAVSVVLNRNENTTFKAVVSLDDRTTESWTHIPDVQPNFTVDEWEEADAALRAHPDVIAALADRGITDLDLVFMDTWTYGEAVTPEKYKGRRLGWSDTWVKASEGANPYAGPVGGFHCVIDVNTMELLEIEDTYRVERPEIMGEYVPRHIPERIRNASTRPPLKPLEINQTDGPSFELDGNKLTWQNWSLRVGFNYREGMTLHAVSYNDNGNVRSVANRMSFAEMVVPYRDHTEDHYRRTAFDIGEWGLGFMTTSLELGCDCLGEIRYLDAVLHNSKGEPYTITNAICIHEEDNAVLWKHVDHDAGAEVRRMRRLTVSFHATVANYEYLVYWRFYQDGNIECEVRATGIMVVTHFDEGGTHPSGTLVDNRTYAPYHQHFLVARLDLDVDGTENTVYSSETQRVPMGPDNPYGLALTQVNTPLTTESEGKQDYDWNTQKAWKVVNDNVTNGLGTRPAYKLVPGAAIPSMFDPASPIFQRAQVIGHTVWVTPNSPDERWPSGEFVNQSGIDHGLPEWTEKDRSIENTDVVVWYTFGIHHITRPEDWPVMPADTVSFWLKPFGFFDRNPSLDVTPSEPKSCHTDPGSTCH